MSGRTTESDACVFCGATEGLTPDHVPPKCFFSKPLPNDLITVPSCERCNKGTEKDDEYFRDIVTCLAAFLHEAPPVQSVLEKVRRSYRRPEQARRLRAFLDASVAVDVVAAGGVYICALPGHRVYKERIAGSLEKIVKGIFWKETGRPLPAQFRVGSWCLVDRFGKPFDAAKRFANEIEILMKSTQPRSVGHGTFVYRFHLARNPFVAAGMVFVFFDVVPFFALAGPRGRVAPPERSDGRG